MKLKSAEQLKIGWRHLVSILTCNEVRSHHFLPYNKKKLNRLKISNFSWAHQRTVAVRKIATLKSGETTNSMELQVEICLPEAEVSGARYQPCFLFYIFWCLDVWGLADSGGTPPLKVSWFLEMMSHLPATVLFKCKPTNSEHAHNHLLS